MEMNQYISYSRFLQLWARPPTRHPSLRHHVCTHVTGPGGQPYFLQPHHISRSALSTVTYCISLYEHISYTDTCRNKPGLFFSPLRSVTSLLKGRQGIYTENERRLANEITLRFFKMMLVFVIWYVTVFVSSSMTVRYRLRAKCSLKSLKYGALGGVIKYIVDPKCHSLHEI